MPGTRPGSGDCDSSSPQPPSSPCSPLLSASSLWGCGGTPATISRIWPAAAAQHNNSVQLYCTVCANLSGSSSLLFELQSFVRRGTNCTQFSNVWTGRSDIWFTALIKEQQMRSQGSPQRYSPPPVRDKYKNTPAPFREKCQPPPLKHQPLCI